MLTNQQIFDKVWDAYVVRGEKPGWQQGRCAYVTDDGRCAVGQLLTDEQIEKLNQLIAEGWQTDTCTGINRLNVRKLFSVLGSDPPTDDMDFLSSLQRAHDLAAMAHFIDGLDFRQEIKQQLDWLAARFLLSIPKEVGS